MVLAAAGRPPRKPQADRIVAGDADVLDERGSGVARRRVDAEAEMDHRAVLAAAGAAQRAVHDALLDATLLERADFAVDDQLHRLGEPRIVLVEHRLDR